LVSSIYNRKPCKKSWRWRIMVAICDRNKERKWIFQWITTHLRFFFPCRCQEEVKETEKPIDILNLIIQWLIILNLHLSVMALSAANMLIRHAIKIHEIFYK
jgi:hypothetical protein